MFKSLRVPEKLFAFVMWAISFVFAAFLIGRLVADLPRLEDRLSRGLRRPRGAAARAQRHHGAGAAPARPGRPPARAQLALTAQRNAYESARQAFQNWLSIRTATTDPAQDPEVVRRTRELDGLKASERRPRRRSSRSTAACSTRSRRWPAGARPSRTCSSRPRLATSVRASHRSCACSARASR